MGIICNIFHGWTKNIQSAFDDYHTILKKRTCGTCCNSSEETDLIFLHHIYRGYCYSSNRDCSQCYICKECLSSYVNKMDGNFFKTCPCLNCVQHFDESDLKRSAPDLHKIY